MITSAWTPLRYHEKQNKLWRTKAKFCAVVAGRGSGKTELARRRIVRYLAVKKPWPDPIYLYALPTYKQARKVAWDPIIRLVPERWIKKANTTTLTIETIFGSKLYIMGMDKPARAEGVQWDGIVLDESSDQRPGIFDLSLLPAMSHRDPWCWRIGVPKRYGIGATEFKKFFDDCTKRQVEGNPNWEAYWWPSEEIVPDHVLEIAKEHLDERDYNEQYCASWEQAGGVIFYCFDEMLNVRDDIHLDHGAPIIIGSDFNVDPMSWVICQEQVIDNEKCLLVLDEIFVRDTNTESTLNRLAERFQAHQHGFVFYGDASGRARKTSASFSDYAQIKNHPFFKTRSEVYYPRVNPLVVNRFAACNAMFKNATGVRRCYVHPRCTNLIFDIKSRAWKPGTREPNDSGDIGHLTDALGYVIHKRYPPRFVAPTPPPRVIVA